MAEQFYTILTAIGKAKIANSAALGEKVELTHLALGDGDGSYYNPTEGQTELKNEVWRGAIGTVDVDAENPNWITIQTVVPTQHGGFMIREAGVFDDDGDLIAVGKYPETYKPVAADGSIKDLVVRMILEVSNTASVVLKVDPTVILATQQQVDGAEARAKAYTDREVAEISQALTSHLAEKATDEDLGHVKVDGETITASNGVISAQTQIVDTVTTDKWVWGMEDGIVFFGKGGDIVTSKIYLGTILGTDGYYYKGVFRLFNLSKIVESPDYGGPINALTQDDNYIYAGGLTTNKVYKLNKSDLSKVAESISYGGYINALTQDDTFVYVGGGTTKKVYKLNKSDLSKVVESVDYGGDILALTQDDTFVYVGGGTTKKVYKLNKSDLSKVVESVDYGGDINALTQDDNFVYVGGLTTNKVYKLNKSNLSKVAESDYGGGIYALTQDDNFVYVGGTTKKVYKLNKSDLSKVAESDNYGGTIYALTQDDNFVYVGGLTTNKVYKLNKSNLSKVAESDYGGGIYALTQDDNYIYAGGNTQKVYGLATYYELVGYRRVE